jgi:hypothetical protein
MIVVVHPPHHAEGKFVGLALGICPENIVAELMIDHVDPSSLRIVFSAVLPVFRVDEINLAVFISLASSSPPVNVFKPFDFWHFQVIEPTKRSYGFLEILGFILIEKSRELTFYSTALFEGRHYHSHQRIP